MPIIDTHNHLYFPGFKDSFETVLESATKAGVTQQILIGIDELSCQAALNLAAQHKVFKVAIGLHPCDVDQLGQYNEEHHQYLGIESSLRPQLKTHADYFGWIDELATEYHRSIIGFGETGFDQFHRQSPELLKLQTECFEAHLDLCLKHQKTLIIHSRGARNETLAFLEQHAEKFKQISFIWHCFTEDLAAAEATIKLGGYIGVGGVITYPKSEDLRSTIQKLPIEHLLTETDAPFLTPHQARKKNKLNIPAFIPEIIETIAHTKAIDVDQCESQLHQNAHQVFKLQEAQSLSGD